MSTIIVSAVSSIDNTTPLLINSGNRTFAAPTNLKIGTLILHVIQDATGGRTLTWNSIFKWPGGAAPVLTTTGNSRDVFSFISDGTNLYGTYIPDVK